MENKELELITDFPKTTHVILGKMMRGFQSSLEDMNLNQTMRRALLILYDKGETTMTELHHAIGLEKGSLTTVVDQLIEKTLVERKRDIGDRRKVNILLTALGRKKVDTLRMEIWWPSWQASPPPTSKRSSISELHSIEQMRARGNSPTSQPQARRC